MFGVGISLHVFPTLGDFRFTARRTSSLFLSLQDRGLRERPEYEEIERIIRETEERALIVERTDVVQAQRIREKIRRLKVKTQLNEIRGASFHALRQDCLETLRQRVDHFEGGEETFHFREKFSERTQRTERAVPQRERVSKGENFAY